MAKKKKAPLGTGPNPLLITRQILARFKGGFDKVVANATTDSDPFKDQSVENVFQRLVLNSVKRHEANINWPDQTILDTAEKHGDLARDVAEQDGLKELDIPTFFVTLDAIKASCPMITTSSGVKVLGLACDF